MAKFGVDPHGRWDKNIAESQFKSHVDNIINKYREATPALLEGGHQWYEKAHDVANIVGRGDVKKGAGIIAALSPMNSWERNIAEAHELTKTGNVASALLPANVDKARRIHEGEDPEKVLGGNKVKSFYQNMADPNNPGPVTIDRHAHDIAVGKPFVGAGGGKAKSNITTGPSGHVPMTEDLGLSSMGRYQHFVHAYRHAAGELNVDVPNKVQATSWVTHRGAIG